MDKVIYNDFAGREKDISYSKSADTIHYTIIIEEEN